MIECVFIKGIYIYIYIYRTFIVDVVGLRIHANLQCYILFYTAFEFLAYKALTVIPYICILV